MARIFDSNLISDLEEAFSIREDDIIIDEDTIKIYWRGCRVIFPNPGKNQKPDRIEFITYRVSTGDKCYLKMEKEMGPSNWERNLLDLIKSCNFRSYISPMSRNRTEDFSDWCKSANLYFVLHPEEAIRPIVITIGEEESSDISTSINEYHYVDGMLKLTPKCISVTINSPRLVLLDKVSADTSVNSYSLYAPDCNQ